MCEQLFEHVEILRWGRCNVCVIEILIYIYEKWLMEYA